MSKYPKPQRGPGTGSVSLATIRKAWIKVMKESQPKVEPFIPGPKYRSVAILSRPGIDYEQDVYAEGKMNEAMKRRDRLNTPWEK